jgi:glycosyltransferase involved in cell wall biosynthesis
MLRKFLKLLPAPVRRRVSKVHQLYRLRRNQIDLRSERPFRSFDGRHVAVAGVFSAGSGLARAAELVALTLEGRGSKVARVDLTVSFRLKAQNADARCISPADCYALDITDVLIVTNPDQPSLLAFDRKWLYDRTIIGHWIWEIELFPRFWERASDSYDEIWTATDLLRTSIKANLPRFDRPLRLLPYAILKDPFPKISPPYRGAVRTKEGIPSGTFVVGYSFSVDSNYYRKNPEDAVRAFFLTFSQEKDVLLVLRSNDLDNRPIERAALEKLIGGDSRVRVYDAARPIGIRDFYAAIDVYLSPSRAEGYGLNLVEAAQSGLPVVTGGWRIAPEILALPGVHTVGFEMEKVHDPQGHYTDIKNAMWSRPNIDELASFLRQMHHTARHRPR